MADWFPITDASISPDAPLTSELAFAWRDNPIAIAEGAAGAPRIADAALLTGPATAAGVTWVGRRMAFTTQAQIGGQVFARYNGIGSVAYSATVDGSTLTATDAAGTGSGFNMPSGSTWRCLGAVTSGTNQERTTMWIRIA